MGLSREWNFGRQLAWNVERDIYIGIPKIESNIKLLQRPRGISDIGYRNWLDGEGGEESN